MAGKSTSRQSIKQTLTSLFLDQNPEKIRTYCDSLATENWSGPLFSLLYSQDPRIKWPAVFCMAEQISRLAQSNMENARILIRRCIWNLNDESGGIGWGLPETMGETLRRSEPLLQEYHRILISYLDPTGNYLELPLLRQGAVWGVARAAENHLDLFTPAISFLQLDLTSSIPSLRAHAIWALGMFDLPDKHRLLSPFLDDTQSVELYTNTGLHTYSISAIARHAIAS